MSKLDKDTLKFALAEYVADHGKVGEERYIHVIKL